MYINISLVHTKCLFFSTIQHQCLFAAGLLLLSDSTMPTWKKNHYFRSSCTVLLRETHQAAADILTANNQLSCI